MQFTAEYGLKINGKGPFRATLETEVELVEIASLNDPDLTWYEIDSSHHFHAYDKDGNLPTLYLFEDSENDIAYYACRICHVPVRPSTKSARNRQYAPGRESAIIVVRGVPHELANHFYRLYNTPVSFYNDHVFGIGTITDQAKTTERGRELTINVISMGWRQ